MPKRLLIVGAIAASLTVSGCVATPGSSTSSTTPVPTLSAHTPEPSPSAGQETASGHTIEGVAHLRDSSGYTMDVSYQFKFAGTSVDISNEKPGKNTVVLDISSHLSAKNTTTSRNIKFPYSGQNMIIQTYAVWKTGSPICVDGAGRSDKDLPCAIPIGYLDLGKELAAGATGAEMGDCLGSAYGLRYDCIPGAHGILDENVDAVRNSLKKPDLLAFTTLNTAGQDWDKCGMQGEKGLIWTSTGKCLPTKNTVMGYYEWFRTTTASQ